MRSRTTLPLRVAVVKPFAQLSSPASKVLAGLGYWTSATKTGADERVGDRILDRLLIFVREVAAGGGVMIFKVTVDFFEIEATSGEQAREVMAEMLRLAGFTRFEVTGTREV